MKSLCKGLTPFLCLILLLTGAAASRPAAADGESVALRAAVAAESRRPLAPRRDRTAFLARSNLADVQLSPKGKQVAFLRSNAGDRSLWLLDTAGGAPRRLLRHSEAERLLWSADGAWLFLVSPRQLFALSLAPHPGSGVMTLFGGRQGRRLLMADPVAPASVLVTEEVRAAGAPRPSGWRLLRLRPSRPAELLFASRYEIAGAALGPSGRLAFVKLVEGEGFAIGRIGAGGPARLVLRCVRLEQCDLLSSPAPRELLLAGDVGGNLQRLLRLDPAGKPHVLHQDPAGESDLADVVLDPATQRPFLASYRSTTASVWPLTPEAGRHVAAIRRGLGASDFRVALGRGPGARWLVAEGGDRLQHGRWHLYDPATGRMREILADVEARARRVPAAAAARRIPFAFRASDGMTIHGFLAVPPGRDARTLPLVVMVHGGPWSHAAPGFSAITQFLADRGYAVFEPNFRGSTGYGRAYAFAGGNDFGDGRVQRDIVEGTRYLLAHGIGDPGRVGIAGISYGGYSSLLGVTFAPDLFRVAVAAMPPVDFGWVTRWQAARERARGVSGIGLQASLRAMAMDPADRVVAARLYAQSPLANAARMKRPLLIVAGGKDESVPIRSIVDYVARLRALGSDVSFFVDPQSGHRMDAPETQEQYLYLLERMLGAHLGVPAGPPPAAAIRRKLERNLRIAGPELRGWGVRTGVPASIPAGGAS